MSGSDLTTLLVALIVGLFGIVTPLIVARFARKTSRSLQEIHVMVNNRMTDAEGRINQLIAALTAAGIQVPAVGPRPSDPSGPPGPDV